MGSSLIGVVPAAGIGSRMGAFGKQLPKALLKIEDQTLLERAIDSLKAIGVTKIIVVVGHLADKIIDFVSTHNFGIDVRTAYQGRPLGLAHAISTASDQIDSDFVVLCPDNIYTNQSDLLRARVVFNSFEPAFILLATVTPNKQRDRKSYFTAGHRNLDANVYEYRSSNSDSSGLQINSTGCVFFKFDTLDFLHSVTPLSREHLFRNYLESIAGQRDSCIYLLRGMRYDFSEPEDINNYVALQKHLSQTEGQGVSAILMNERGQVLLQQRDDNPSIRYPGHWSLFGGTIESGECAEDAVAREVREEIGFELENFGLLRQFVQNNKREFAFVGELTVPHDQLTLREGQAMDVFRPSELKRLLIRPDDKESLEQYFGALV